MMTTAEKKKKSLMKRRIVAAIIAAVLVLILGIATFLVLSYVKTVTFEDVDGTTYYIRPKDGVYAMYDSDKNKLPTDEQYGYYVTSLGTLVKVNAETGAWSVYATVDTEGNEVVGFNSRLLIFPHIEKKNILSLEVYNSHGKYTFARYNEEGNKDIGGDFIITHSPLTAYNQELFASLYVGAGYTLSLMKLENPIKDANGEFSEYGLVAETRVRTHDEQGNELETPEEYQYEPIYYILTDGSGNRYKVIIGDPLVTGGGYYAQYVDLSGETAVKRDAVYVLDTETGLALSAPIEDYVTPILTYPMSMNTYFDVDRFTIGKMKDDKTPGDDELYDKKITFTYIDLSLRENTLQASFPYEFSIELDGYTPSSNNIDYVLQKIYSPTFEGVKLLAPSGKDLAEYGIYAQELNEDGTPKVDEKGNPVYTPFSKYTISFNYDILDEKGKYVSTINQMILISDKNENGNYYAYTIVSNLTEKDGEETLEILYTYDMIVEVSGHDLAFLEWSQFEWINSSYVNGNIAYVTDITLSSPDYNASFELDNSQSIQNETNSSLLQVHGKDSLGNDVTTFSKLQYTDKNGFTWVVTESDIKVYDSTGAERKIAKGESFYDYNILGSQVLCKTNPINCTDKQVEVTANEVRVLYNDGRMETYTRFNTGLFRKFFQTLLYATIVDSYEMSAEDEAALIADESKLILTMTFTTKDVDGTVKTNTYRFYHLSSRKAYITINGNGGFYVQRNRVEKFVTDAQKFFNETPIDPTGKV